MIVQGAIGIKNLKELSNGKSDLFCFVLNDSEEDQWELCSDDEKGEKEWVCSIKKVLGFSCENV